MNDKIFPKFAWIVLGYTLLVVLWGALVRATGSGAGCGAHWPLCNGEFVPRTPEMSTIIEYVHRATSGIVLILIAALFYWSRKIYPAKNVTRLFAGLSLIFVITEALLGAGLVLLKLVENDQSAMRAQSIVLHLCNTFVLVGCLSVTSWTATKNRIVSPFSRQAKVALPVLIGFLIVGASGAITALGDTLFPVSSLREGFSQDLDPARHFLISLRVWHPFFAVFISAYIFAFVFFAQRKYEELNGLSLWVTILIVVQIFAGFINLFLLAPTWLQLVHLFLADALWIALIIFVYEYIRQRKMIESV